MRTRLDARHEAFVARVAAAGRLPPNRRGLWLYRLSKEVDGRLDGTGTFPLFARRVDKLYRLAAGRSGFYEPVDSPDELLRLSRVNARLLRGNAPVWSLNNLSASVRLFESVYGARFGVPPLPEPGEAEQGVHHLSLYGGPTRWGGLRFTNSWGGGWGYDGRGVLSREYLDGYMVEAWLDRPAGAGPTRFALPLLRRATSPKAFAAAWVPTLRGLGEVSFATRERRILHDDADHLLRTHETLSASGDPVEMIELHGPTGLPLGWAHLHYLITSRPGVSACKEFFVWPFVRGFGYGRLLEEHVAERAERWGSERLEVPLYEADDHPGAVHPAKAFATASGYEWSWVYKRRPNVSAVASKGL